jgi:hypothetical protein
MITFSKVLKFLGCAFGGAVVASLILLVVGACIFGFRDLDRFGRFLAVANPIVGVLGAVAGAIIFARRPARP